MSLLTHQVLRYVSSGGSVGVRGLHKSYVQVEAGLLQQPLQVGGHQRRYPVPVHQMKTTLVVVVEVHNAVSVSVY